jgi:hypothetical protein
MRSYEPIDCVIKHQKGVLIVDEWCNRLNDHLMLRMRQRGVGVDGNVVVYCISSRRFVPIYSNLLPINRKIKIHMCM